MSVTTGEGPKRVQRDPKGLGREMLSPDLPVLRFHMLSQTEGKTEDANSKGIWHRMKQWFSTGTNFVMTGGRED